MSPSPHQCRSQRLVLSATHHHLATHNPQPAFLHQWLAISNLYLLAQMPPNTFEFSSRSTARRATDRALQHLHPLNVMNSQKRNIEDTASIADPNWKRPRYNSDAPIVISDDEDEGDSRPASPLSHERAPAKLRGLRLEPQQLALPNPGPTPPLTTMPTASVQTWTLQEVHNPVSSSNVDGNAQAPYSHQELVDHLGRPLSAQALASAYRYWECQREFDHCPFDADEDVQGPQPLIDPLLRMARYRRDYTQLILGLDHLDPGTRTFEPPYVEPEPVLRAPDALALVEPTPVAPLAPIRRPVLDPDQESIVRLAESGRNIFYTGSAGCGKSTVLHVIKERLESLGKDVRVMAPTGKVALAINGTTTWTYAGWNPDSYKRTMKELENRARGKVTRKRFEKTDVIIIDEISMVENLHLERLNAVMKAGRQSPLPFGGVQIIVTGDFCQLPPVKPFCHCMYCGLEFHIQMIEGEHKFTCKACNISYTDQDKWAFMSRAWKECNFAHVLLSTIHRQNDAQFVGLLQKCRMGESFTPDEVDLLMNHPSKTSNAVKLFATREEVRRTNMEAFDRLCSPPRPYICYDEFIWLQHHHPTLKYKAERQADGSLSALREHRFEPSIQLKAGMLVVLLVNLDLTQGLCNGSQGVIVGFEPYDPDKLPRKSGASDRDGGGLSAHSGVKESHIRRFSEKQKAGLGWPIVQFHNGARRTVYPECQVHEVGETKPYSLLCRTQVPLSAAWALSIHKSQGMTLDRVIVDLSKSFEEGQVYVALSRATSLDGLKVVGDPKGLKVSSQNPEVSQFLYSRFGSRTAKLLPAP